MTKGRMLNRTPKASLIGNDIVDARSTVITSITHDWNRGAATFGKTVIT